MATPKWVVTSVTPYGNYTLDIEFSDGKVGRFDMGPYLERRPYRSLNNLGLFMLAHVECGTVVWNDMVDMAPELLYEGCAVMDDRHGLTELEAMPGGSDC